MGIWHQPGRQGVSEPKLTCVGHATHSGRVALALLDRDEYPFGVPCGRGAADIAGTPLPPAAFHKLTTYARRSARKSACSIEMGFALRHARLKQRLRVRMEGSASPCLRSGARDTRSA